jgi:serine/threonine-protein kinase HipA
MTSEHPQEAYVWVWLPGSDKPVVAGRLEVNGGLIDFNYGQSYLRREGAISLYTPELPLAPGRIPPVPGLAIPSCLADAGPNAWGKRVIMNRLLGAGTRDVDPAALDPLTYLLESGSNRIGALDFQGSATDYVPRHEAHASLEEMMNAAELVDEGIPLSPALTLALMHASSVGGARPKTLLTDGARSLIAKFSSTSDPYSVVKGEYAAMELAARAGLHVAPVKLARVLGKSVLLVERFDRPPGTAERRGLVSALTILGLDPMLARYASYAELSHIIRARFTDPKDTLRELFARITFNILVGNTDDHARNHAAFWDGSTLTLTPAYDICPQPRAGGEASQAMIIASDGYRMSQVAGCIRAGGTYGLSERQATEIVSDQLAVIRSDWSDVCELAEMTETDRAYFWERQFLNPYAIEGLA